jgi:excisionase family DNA binding protein
MPIVCDLEPLLTVDEVAELTRLARTTIYDKARAGLIPYLRLNGTIRFQAEAIKAWLNRHVYPERPTVEDNGKGR